MAGLREPVVAGRTGRVLVEAWAGLTHVLVRNPTLRGIALVVSLMNIGLGVLVVAVPVMVFQRLHGSPVFVGQLWAIYGLSSVPSALLFGRVNTEGRERLVMTLCAMTAGLGVALLAIAGSPWMAAGAMLIAGLANGPFDVSMFSLRQRRTDPAWFGRAFAVSMGVNWAGQPIGSAMSGPLIHFGLVVAFLAGACFVILGATLTGLVVPSEDAGRIAGESARQPRREGPVEESPSSVEQGAG
jgi:predicted MFS family arabinose efflux permease